MAEVLKREVVDGEKAEEAQKKINRSNRKARMDKVQAEATVNSIPEVAAIPIVSTSPSANNPSLENQAPT